MAQKGSGVLRSTAEKILEEIVRRADEANANADFAYSVMRIAVFGSYVNSEKDKLGDLDIAVDLAPRYDDDEAQHRAEAEALRRRGPHTYSIIDRAYFPRCEVERCLRDSRRCLHLHSFAELQQLNVDRVVIYPRGVVRCRTGESPTDQTREECYVKDVRDAHYESETSGDDENDGCDCDAYPGLEISYTGFPSQAIARTGSQFVLLRARCGPICAYMKESLSYLLEDVDRVQKRLGTDEYIQLRAVWFNDATGGYVVYIDFVHDDRNEPSLSDAQLIHAFHDGSVAYPDGQPITVQTYFTQARTVSELFSPICDSYYERIRDEIGWK